MNVQSARKIFFTGGGTAGHVIPNLALIAKCKQENWNIYYIGSHHGLEKNLVLAANVEYFSISAGKLRRYFCWKNIVAPAQILFGIVQAWQLCHRIRPDIVFSKGGYVAFPLVLAAWLSRIPVIVHESDLTPGLANRLSFPFARKICLTMETSRKYIFGQKDKLIVTGTPIRPELLHGDAALGRKICQLRADKKIIFVQGGGLGSDIINKLLRELLPSLLVNFQIVHSCGKGKVDLNFNAVKGYRQFEYITHALPHVLASADLVISRAGANSIYELVALKKPHILLPLSRKASRGDQLSNAEYYSQLGLSRVIYPEKLNAENLAREIYWVLDNRDAVVRVLAGYHCHDGVKMIYNLLSGLKK